MANYQVTVSTSSNYDIGPKKASVKPIDVNTDIIAQTIDGITEISQMTDVNQNNKQNNYVLIWDEVNQEHIYVSPFEILDRADGTDDDAIDYGTY